MFFLVFTNINMIIRLPPLVGRDPECFGFQKKLLLKTQKFSQQVCHLLLKFLFLSCKLCYSLFSHDVTRYPYLGVRHYGAPRQRNLMQISSHFYSSSHESRNTFRFDHGYFTGKLQ